MLRVSAFTVVAIAVSMASSTVPWTEVRIAVAESICVLAYPNPDGSDGYNAVAGVRAYCKLPPADTPLQRAVVNAYERAQPLTASIRVEGLSAAYEKGLTSDERTRRARQAYLASEDFLRAVIPRVRNAMSAGGLVCAGCPEFLDRPIHKVPWTEFAPYLAAYAWPDPVQTPKDANDKPSGMPKYSFHVCGGLNGIDEIKDPDPLLVRAGFVAAYQSGEFRQSAGAQLIEAVSAPEFLALRDDEARTRYLQHRVPPETVKDQTVRAAACRELRDFKADLGVEISDCGEAPTTTLTLEGH